MCIQGEHGALSNNQKFLPHPAIEKEEEESHFFTYFSLVSLLCIGMYVGYHNKQKVEASISVEIISKYYFISLFVIIIMRFLCNLFRS